MDDLRSVIETEPPPPSGPTSDRISHDSQRQLKKSGGPLTLTGQIGTSSSLPPPKNTARGNPMFVVALAILALVAAALFFMWRSISVQTPVVDSVHSDQDKPAAQPIAATNAPVLPGATTALPVAAPDASSLPASSGEVAPPPASASVAAPATPVIKTKRKKYSGDPLKGRF
jgi:hypothetical protein